MKNLLVLLIIIYPVVLFADFLNLQWKKDVSTYKRLDFFSEGLFIGKISSANRQELFYIIHSGTNRDTCYGSILDGETSDYVLDSLFCYNRFLAMFDRNRDGYNEIYTGADSIHDQFEHLYYKYIDLEDEKSAIDSLGFSSTDWWKLTYDNKLEDTVLVTTGRWLLVCSYPSFEVRRKLELYEYYFSEFEIGDFDNDNKREIAILFRFPNPRFEVYDFETLSMKYSMDLVIKGYDYAHNLIPVKNYKSGYYDFIMAVKPDNEKARVVKLDGVQRELVWEGDEGTDNPVKGDFNVVNQLAVSYFLGDFYWYILVYDLGTMEKVWISPQFTIDEKIKYMLGGNLMQSGQDELVVATRDGNYRNNIYVFNSEPIGFNNSKNDFSFPAKHLSVSPNPFSSRLSVSLPSSGSVYSLTGQLIMNLPKGKHSIDTNSWREGVYIVKSGKETKRVVKVR